MFKKCPVDGPWPVKEEKHDILEVTSQNQQ
jgi:hypothetical protein